MPFSRLYRKPDYLPSIHAQNGSNCGILQVNIADKKYWMKTWPNNLVLTWSKYVITSLFKSLSLTTLNLSNWKVFSKLLLSEISKLSETEMRYFIRSYNEKENTLQVFLGPTKKKLLNWLKYLKTINWNLRSCWTICLQNIQNEGSVKCHSLNLQFLIPNLIHPLLNLLHLNETQRMV